MKAKRTTGRGSVAPVTRQAARPTSPAVLTKQQVTRRLHAHAASGQVVTAKWLQAHDLPTYRGALAHFGGLAGARSHAGVAPLSFAFWSRERVLDELRRIHRRGRVRITSNGLIAAGYQGLLSAIYVIFGSLPRARRLAGIPAPGYRPPDTIHRWDEDSVISEIRGRYRSKQSLAVTKVPRTLVEAAIRYCGGWRAAIEMAGFDYESIRLHRRSPTRKELIALVRDIDPSSVQKRGPSERRSNAALIDELRAFVARTPPPTSGQLFGTRLGRQAVVRFGNRDAVIRKIGVSRWSPRCWRPLPSTDELVRWLQTRHRSGRHMSSDAAKRDGSRYVYACYQRFGSWRAAMQAAGLGDLIGGRKR